MSNSTEYCKYIFLLVLGFLLWHGNTTAADRVIEGTVINSENKEPLPFATILILGTNVGTSSNFEGRFVLSVPENDLDSILVCSYVGFKDFRINIRQFINQSQIKLIREIVELKNLEVRPWKAWDYVQAALTNLSQNYSSTPYLSEGYYSENLSENDQFLKYSEGVVQTYNPVYGDTAKSHSRLIQARRKNNLSQLRFMRDKIDKKMQKEMKEHHEDKNHQDHHDRRDSVDQPKNIDEAILKSSFGGPDAILGTDPIRDTAEYLNPEKAKKFRYTIEGYSSYHDEDVIMIGYESKGHIEHQKITGRIYISLIRFAIVAIDYENRIVIPDAVRPIIFVMGYGVTDPVISGKIHYKPMNDRWYLNDIAIDGSVRLTKMKVFSKDDRSLFRFKQSLINTDFDLEKAKPIPKDQWLDTRKPLEDQVKEDPEFWKKYPVARPIE
jgi:hypothetical protein